MSKSIKYTLINYLVLFANFLREMVLLSFLSSEQVGVWRIFITIFGYLKYFSLGLPSLIVYRGRRKNLQLMYYRYAIPVVLISNFLLSIVLFSYIYFFEESLHFVLFFLFPFVLVVALFNVYSSYFMGVIEILKASLSNFVVAFLFLLMVFLFSVSDAHDAIFFLLFSYLCSVLYLLYFFFKKHGSLFLLSGFVKKRAVRLLRLSSYAIKSSFSSFLFYFFTSIDVILLKGSYGVSFIGLFSPVLIFYNLMLNAVSVFNVLLMAKFKSFLELSILNSAKVTLLIFVFSGSLVLLFCVLYFQLSNAYFPKYLQFYEESVQYLLCIPFLVINGYVLTLLIANNGVGKYSFVISMFLFIKLCAYGFVSNDLVIWLAAINALCIVVVIYVFFGEVVNEVSRRHAREK